MTRIRWSPPLRPAVVVDLLRTLNTYLITRVADDLHFAFKIRLELLPPLEVIEKDT
jgi:hypothetical protein